MIEIPKLEIHISHACNLSCTSCSHYSNFRHKGLITAKYLDESLRLWADKVSPKSFRMLGGEPFVNKELPEMCYIARKFFKNNIRVTSNILLTETLQNIERYAQSFADNNIQLYISMHSIDKKYVKKFEKALSIWEKLSSKFNFEITAQNYYTNWFAPYKTVNGIIHPYNDNSPRESWKSCGASQCKQLYGKKIYKCPAITYLPMMREKNLTSLEFDKYIDTYESLAHDASVEDMKKFFAKEEEYICNMCPKILPRSKKEVW